MMIFTKIQKDYEDNVTSKITLEVFDDLNIHDTMQEFRRFLLAVSFTPGTVDQYIEAD